MIYLFFFLPFPKYPARNLNEISKTCCRKSDKSGKMTLSSNVNQLHTNWGDSRLEAKTYYIRDLLSPQADER